MNDSDTDCGLNAIVLVVGAIAALAVAGIIGRAVYSVTHSADRIRDVADIISECQGTVAEIDRALRIAQPVRA